MSSTNNDFTRSISSLLNDDTMSSTEMGNNNILSNTNQPTTGVLFGLSWQTWLIIVLILALLGINIFAYLAKGTQDTVTIIDKIFAPIFKLFGFSLLETTKQIIQTTATGTETGIGIVSDTSVGAINKLEQIGGSPVSTSGTSVGISTAPSSNVTAPKGQMATSSQKGSAVLTNAQLAQKEATLEQRQYDSLEKALSNASQSATTNQDQVQPNDADNSGKSGWCFIGEDLGVRTCSQVGVNDMCMSGDVFPTQEICMNPNLRQ